MAKSGKMQHKQIMAMNGTSVYNWPKFSETANKVVNVRLFLYMKNGKPHILLAEGRKQYFLPNCQEVKF